MIKKLILLNLGTLLIVGSVSAQNCNNCSVVRSGYGVPLQLTTGECAELTYGLTIAECNAMNAVPKDTDRDGVLDKNDACPLIVGMASAKGCPDADGDGIKDADDDCPENAGLIAFKGYPDTDGDSIADKEDACPQVAGVSAFKGCKDTDGDGLSDPNDKCPLVFGKANLMGCPDQDGDGIADGDDKCPVTPGLIANKGCPEVDKKTKEVLRKALRGLQFEVGKDVIKKPSFPILDNVAAILNEHPEYLLDIAGHTDNTGYRESNVTLSENRAAAAKKYIISKGISADRLRSEGYGPDRPIADNKLKAGKALNRRVEFIVEF